MPRSIFLFILIFTVSFTNYSIAGSGIKKEKVDVQDLKITQCPIDSNATAYYIFNNGSSRTHYHDDFKHTIERRYRIKILHEDAVIKYSVLDIPLFKGNSVKGERFVGISANTYNLVDGKVVRTKFNKRKIEYHRKSYHWEIIRIKFENVQVGSIIDVEYQIENDFYSRNGEWQFQHEIPVLESSFIIEAPEQYNYKDYRFGNLSLKLESHKSPGSIESENASFPITNHVFKYSAKIIPAKEEQHYSSAVEDQPSKLEYGLIYRGDLMKPTEQYYKTWFEVGNSLQEYISFGITLKRDECFKDEAKKINSEYASDMEKMEAAFSYIKNNMSWNNEKSVFASQNLALTKESGKGNSADINLSLVALLRRIGLHANPIVLSTRDNGVLYEYLPSVRKLNYVIASCNIDGDTIHLDATNKNLAINELPSRCLTDRGIMVSLEQSSTWVSLLAER